MAKKKNSKYLVILDDDLKKPLNVLTAKQGTTVKRFVSGLVRKALEEVKV